MPARRDSGAHRAGVKRVVLMQPAPVVPRQGQGRQQPRQQRQRRQAPLSLHERFSGPQVVRRAPGGRTHRHVTQSRVQAKARAAAAARALTVTGAPRRAAVAPAERRGAVWRGAQLAELARRVQQQPAPRRQRQAYDGGRRVHVVAAPVVPKGRASRGRASSRARKAAPGGAGRGREIRTHAGAGLRGAAGGSGKEDANVNQAVDAHLDEMIEDLFE